MLQPIEAHYRASNGGYGFEIMSAYQLDHKIHVITKLSTPNGPATCSLAFHKLNIVVQTDSVAPLEIIYYLINHEDNRRLEHIHGYTDIKEEDEPKLFGQAKVLYKPRLDGLKGLRLADFEDKSVSHALTFSSKRQNTQDINPKHLLNIYSVVKEDTVKLVFETVSKAENRYCSNINESLVSMENALGDKILSLENDLLMQSDDRLTFVANHNQSKAKFLTHACEFYIPLKSPEKFLYFLMFADAAIESGRQVSQHSTAYSHIQMSRDSIFACFKDLYVFNGGYYTGGGIENEMDSSLEEFLGKPGTMHQPDSVLHEIFQALLRENNSPQLNMLKSYIRDFYKTFNADDRKALRHYVALLYSSSDVAEAEKILNQPKYFNVLKPLIVKFQHRILDRLLERVCHSISPWSATEPRYNWHCPEFELFRNAIFLIRPDGRLSFALKDNPVFQKHYSENATKHSVFEAEMKRLAGKLGVQFAEDTNFTTEIIFTSESTLLLKPWGLHINQANLKAEAGLVLDVNMAAFEPEEGEVVSAIAAPTALSADPQFNILRQIGIDSEVSRRLLLSNPLGAEILSLMFKGKIFEDNIANIKFHFATLMHVLSAMPDDSMRLALLKLYQRLSSDPASYLNLSVHQKIMRIASTQDFQGIVNLICQLPLTQQMVNQIFYDASSYLFFSTRVSVDKLMLILKPDIDPKDVQKCVRELHWEAEWFNAETFTDIALHIDQCEDVIHGFKTLHKFNLLVTHKNQFLQNPSSAKALHELKMWGLLDVETIQLTLEHPNMLDAAKALEACSGDHLVSHQNKVPFLKMLLSRPDLVAVMNVLGHKKDDYYTRDQTVIREAYQDLKELVKSTGFRQKFSRHHFFGDSPRSPSPVSPPPRDLEECTRELQRKHGLVVEQREDQGMSASSPHPG